MCRSMADIQSATDEIRRGIKKDRKKPQGKNIMSASATQGGHKKLKLNVNRKSTVRTAHVCAYHCALLY